MQQFGTVIIGRNEGERLRRCVRSVLSHCAVVVYVDSGSEDDSVEFCTQQGVDIIELDPGIPFSAARARNEGMQLLNQKYPELSYIQFVDGDCEVFDQWFDQALTHLAENKSLAIVCGRRKERHPDQSVYNRLCDIEWNTPVGIADACGGDFLARVEALTAVAGFNPEVVAGEEPEMCYRLRAKGWEIERIDAEMTKHDAMIARFSQWWRRTLRSGHAYAHTMILHWGEKERLNVRSVMSIMVWGLGVPVIFLAALLLGLPDGFILPEISLVKSTQQAVICIQQPQLTVLGCSDTELRLVHPLSNLVLFRS
jgi:GT2 family glycosyltransferase